jgi:broad specificity phosphatase PhoE
MELLLVRHAHDVGSAVPGRPLSDRGRRQAAALAQCLHGLGISAVRSSTRTRAKQTAELAAEELGLPVVCDARLDEIVRVNPAQAAIAPPRERRLGVEVTGTESWSSFLVRVSSYVSELCQDEDTGQRIVVVTHSGVFDAVHEVLTGAGRRVELDIAHTGLTIWQHRVGSAAGTWLLRCHNFLGHLDGDQCLPLDLPAGLGTQDVR